MWFLQAVALAVTLSLSISLLPAKSMPPPLCLFISHQGSFALFIPVSSSLSQGSSADFFFTDLFET